MTKKLLISAVSFCALSTSASNFDGWHGGFKLGYSTVTATANSNQEPGGHVGVDGSNGGFTGGAFVGYNQAICGSNWILGLGGGFDYSAANVKILNELEDDSLTVVDGYVKY